MHVQSITLFDKKTEHVRLVEGYGVVDCSVVWLKSSDLEIFDFISRVVLDEGGILDIDIEQFVPVLLDVSQIDWVSEDNSTG
jgi:hypothetical protein